MIEQLRRVGLSEYEAKAYLTLLRLGIRGGQSVAKVSGVPPTRVYDALHSLVHKGLVTKIQDKPLVFTANKPELALKQLLERHVQRLKDTEKELVSALKTIKPKRTSDPKIHESVTTVLGFDKMYQHVINTLNNANREFLVFSVGEEIPFAMKVASQRAKRRGCNLKFIATKNDSENIHILRERIKDGWQVRYYPSDGDYTFAIFDKKVAFTNVRNPLNKNERISNFFEVPGMAKALADHFDHIWKKSKPITL